MRKVYALTNDLHLWSASLIILSVEEVCFSCVVLIGWAVPLMQINVAAFHGGSHFLEYILLLIDERIAGEIDKEGNNASLDCDVAWKLTASEKIIQIC